MLFGQAVPRVMGEPSAGFGTLIAAPPSMTDEKYVSLLLWTICLLMFACGVVALTLTQHPDWFGA